MRAAKQILPLLISLTLYSAFNCSTKKPARISKIDTIDFSVVWINKSYLTQLKRIKSHAKLWDKYEISWLGLAPNNESMILVKRFWSGGGYKQSIINNELKLISDDQNQPDTLRVVWIEKGKTLLIN